MKSCWAFHFFVVLHLTVCSTFQGDSEILETVYVAPESSLNFGVCKSDPCIMVSQLTETINISSTFVFMSGYHILDLRIHIFKATAFSMIALSSRTYSASQVNIVCQHDSNFNFENISHVRIENLSFIGCGNNKIISCDRLTVENCTFIGHNGSGTALEVIETSAYVINCSFIHNRVGSYQGPIEDPFNSTESVFAYIGGAVISNQSHITIVNSSFKGNRAELGGVIFLTMGSNVTMINSVLASNCAEKVDTSVHSHASYYYGGALFCENSSITLNNCELCDNHASYGGVIFTNNGIVTASLSKFCDSTAKSAGVLMAYDHSNVSIIDCNFLNNSLHTLHNQNHGGVIVTYASIVSISRSLFSSNMADAGGVMSITDPPSIVTIHQSEFRNNSAWFGGVLSVLSKGSTVTIMTSFFDNNTVNTQGGVLNLQAQSTMTFIECIFSNNCANVFSGGVICVSGAKSLILRGCQFINNSAINYVGGAIRLQGAHLTLENTSLIANRALSGGAIYLSERSFVNFHGSCSLANNTADQGGGALFAFDSALYIYGHLEITSNFANILGGGAMLSHSEVTCWYNGTFTITRNKALNDGGGIYASNSYIVVLFDRCSKQNPSVNFTGNVAGRWGGGIFLLMGSSLHFEKKGEYDEFPAVILYFTENSAEQGGAIYVADETIYGTCSTFDMLSTVSDCFIQILSPQDTLDDMYDVVSVNFDQNRAVSSGSVLFGGLLDRCTLRHDSEFLQKMGYDINNPLNFTPPVNGFTYFQNISNIGYDDNSDTPWIISSLPVRVCFCQSNEQHNCSYKPDTLSVKKGERFNVSLVAVDQVNHTLGDTIIYSSLSYAESGLGDGQVIQTAKNYCTPLNFSIHSPHSNEMLIFYPEGPCRNASKSLSTITVEFSNCTCPIGFQARVSEKTNCVCECDSRLLHSCIAGCNTKNQTLTRKNSCWVSLLKDKLLRREYVTYPDCPSDYCNSNPQINLNTVNGSDVQCNNQHTGILCGLCKSGYSLSLGSSHCVSCSEYWPISFVLILFAAILSGITFVALIMILNLTVAIGKMNGLIFYANIIDSSKNIFYIPSCKVYSILLSWLNLDIGFDVCFYEGLNVYWKTWLQLAFPMYVISLVTIIVLLSRCSMKFSMLLAKKNPVSTLATLILFSYTKLLRTVIVVLSKANLKYTDHNIHKSSVWLFDPNVNYGTGKHIPLFVVAILILIVGVIYTFLLLSWQWLLKYVRYQKVCHFFDPYHAPYRFKHRYWTGLLLLARVAIYIVIISFGHGDPNINLLTIISIVSVLLFLKGHAVFRLYVDWKTDVIETVCYLNIVLFSTVKIIILNTSNQRIYHNITTNVSGLIALLLLIYVLIQQFLSEVVYKYFWKKFNQRVRRAAEEVASHGELNITGSDLNVTESPQNPPKPTTSVIEGLAKRESNENAKNASADISEQCYDDDAALIVSADSTTPLL